MRKSQNSNLTQSITLRFHNPMYNKLFVKDIAAMLRGEMARYAIGLYTNFSIENDQQILQLKPDIELISVDNTPAAVSKKMVNRLFCEEEKNLRNNSFSTFRAIHSNQSPILTVGDLWLHDNETRSLSAHFMGQFPVFQISGNLINAFESDSLRKTRRYTKAKQLIISNGLSELLNQTISSETIRIKKIIEQQQIVLSKITIQHPNIKIWIHGYDYFASNVKKYGKLIDEYNEQLAEMTSTLEMVSYIDLRGSLHQGQWESDYLPNNDGFEVLAGRFFAKLLN